MSFYDSKQTDEASTGENAKEEPTVRSGNYLLGRTLGEGSFGKVKLAHHVKTDQVVAIKIVDKGGMVDVDDVDRIYREVLILTHLKHKNIIKLIEVYDAGKSIMLAMEFAGGGDLYDFWKQKKRLTEVQACRVFHQVIAGVEFCHRVKVIHRDLKLENILLDDEGTIKIADFGLSNSIKFGQKLGTHCGTPSYSAPEQIRGEDYVGAAADVWSLGVILYTLIAGFLPFEADSLPMLFKKIQLGYFTYPEYFSQEVVALLTKMFHPEASKRVSVADIRNDPWFLMEYSGLVNDINAMREVTMEMVGDAHMSNIEKSDSDLKQHRIEREAEREERERERAEAKERANAEPAVGQRLRRSTTQHSRGHLHGAYAEPIHHRDRDGSRGLRRSTSALDNRDNGYEMRSASANPVRERRASAFNRMSSQERGDRSERHVSRDRSSSNGGERLRRRSASVRTSRLDHSPSTRGSKLPSISDRDEFDDRYAPRSDSKHTRSRPSRSSSPSQTSDPPSFRRASSVQQRASMRTERSKAKPGFMQETHASKSRTTRGR